MWIVEKCETNDKDAREQEAKANEKETELRTKADVLYTDVEYYDRFRRKTFLTAEEKQEATDIYNDLFKKTEEASGAVEVAGAEADAWTREVKVTSGLLSQAKARLYALEYLREAAEAATA